MSSKVDGSVSSKVDGRNLRKVVEVLTPSI